MLRCLFAMLLVACGADPAQIEEPGSPVEHGPPEAGAEQTGDGTEAPELPVPTDAQYAASHILIAWKGAVRAPSTIERSKSDARTLATELHERIAKGASLDDLARQHSDGPSAPRGGSIGVYLTGTMVPGFEAAVASVEPGELAPLVETPFGWHVIRRDAVKQVRIRHILVSHADAHQSVSDRTLDEARARAAEIVARLDNGDDFATVAGEMSDDAPTAARGGDIGIVAPGQMVPDFEAAAMALEPGKRSDVIETAYGLHILLRTE